MQKIIDLTEVPVKIDPNKIPQHVYDIASSILDTAVRRYFEKPGVREAYEKWLPTYEKEQQERLKGLAEKNGQ